MSDNLTAMKTEGGSFMHRAIEWFLWGLCMGMGWSIAANVLNFIAQFIHASH